MSNHIPVERNRSNYLFFDAGDLLAFRTELGVNQTKMGHMLSGAMKTKMPFDKSYISRIESGEWIITESVHEGYLSLQKDHMKKNPADPPEIIALRHKQIGQVMNGEQVEKVLIDINDAPIVSPVAHVFDGQRKYYKLKGQKRGTMRKTKSASIPVLRAVDKRSVLGVG